MRALAACGSIALLLAACGARTELDEGVAAAGDAAAGHAIDAAVDAAHEATDASAPHADAARDAGTDAAGEDASTARQFQGVVLALWTPAGATPFQAYADFTTAQAAVPRHHLPELAPEHRGLLLLERDRPA